MKARRFTQITLQTDEAFVIRRTAGSVQALCAECGSIMPMVTPEEGSILFGIAVRSIYRGLEAGELHFQETSSGPVVVCLDSLRKLASPQSEISIHKSKNKKEIQK